MEKVESSYIAGGNVKYSHFGKEVWHFVKHNLPHNSAISLLVIHPGKIKMYVNIKTCM